MSQNNFDQTRNHTPETLRDTQGVLKRKVACETCRKARAKCDADANFTLPCSRCVKKKKGAECKPATKEKGSETDSDCGSPRELSMLTTKPPPGEVYTKATHGSNSRQEQAGSLPGGVVDQYYGHQFSNFAAGPKYYQEAFPAQSYVPSTTYMHPPPAQAQEFHGRNVIRGPDPYSSDYGWLTPYSKADISQIHSAPGSGRVQAFNWDNAGGAGPTFVW